MFSPFWEFRTREFLVAFTAEEEPDLDLSWDDDGSVARGLETGEYVAFAAVVRVYWRGREVARDYLGNCIYRSVDEFVSSHRDPDPMNRNCSIMRAARGPVTLCDYFPDMIRTAVAEAREALADFPHLRKPA